MATFDDLIRKIENLETEILNLSGKKITILPDANGMIDRECPKAECNSHFKVNSDDWQMKVKKEEAFCPFCHNNSEAQDYLPQHQREEILKSIRRSIMDNWKYGTPILHNIIRLESQEEFELKIVCENCNMRFSVIGAAYF